MEHKGIEFTVVQSIERRRWVWAVETDRPRTGNAGSKVSAIKKAQQFIDEWLREKP